MTTTWTRFRERYESEYVRHFRPATRASYKTALNVAERLLAPQVPDDIADLNRFFQKATENNAVSRDSADTYCKKLTKAHEWACQHRMASKTLIQPNRPKNTVKKLPAEPLEPEHIEALFNAATSPDVLFLLKGLLYSGMRINEAEQFTWGRGSFRPKLIDPPMFEIDASGDKAGRDRSLPMTTEFAELLQQVPPDERKGYVFLPDKPRHELRRIVAAVGVACGVKTARGKFATAHDFRRTFASMWALQVEPIVLQQLMRHDSLETTMRYYVRVRACDVAKKIQGMRAFG